MSTPIRAFTVVGSKQINGSGSVITFHLSNLLLSLNQEKGQEAKDNHQYGNGNPHKNTIAGKIDAVQLKDSAHPKWIGP